MTKPANRDGRRGAKRAKAEKRPIATERATKQQISRLRKRATARQNTVMIDVLPTAKTGGFPPRPAPDPRKESDVL